MGNCWPNQEQTKLLQACLFSGSCAKKAWEDWAKQINFDKIDHASYKLLPLISRNVDLPEDPLFEKQAGRPVRLVRPSGVLALDVRTPICDLTCEALGVDPVRRG